MNGFTTSDLNDFERDLLTLARERMPSEYKKFLRKEADKLKKKTKAVAKARVGKESGEYNKGIKRGKVYTYSGTGDLSIRTYSGKPHAHLIEYGHRQVVNPMENGKRVKGKGIGVEVGFVPGKHVFETARNQFEPEFYSDAQQFIDDALERGL